VHRGRVRGDPPGRRRDAQRVDDACLRNRPGSRDAGVHVPAVDPGVRRPGAGDARGAHGRRLGDQPGRGRGRHPSTGSALPRPNRSPRPGRWRGSSSVEGPALSRPEPVPSAEPVLRVRPYHEGMTSPLRSLWDAPAAVPPPPRRVWRDWALVAVLPLVAVFEAAARPDDVPWRWLWAGVLVATVPTLLWRGRPPLLIVGVPFGGG